MSFKYGKYRIEGSPYKLKGKHGNYRIYDASGQQVWKSVGKSKADYDSAVAAMNSLYKGFLSSQKTPQSQQPQEKKEFEDIAKEGFEERGKALADIKDDRYIFKMLLDKANAIVNDRNREIENFSDRFSLTDIIYEWRVDPAKIPQELKPLLAGKEGQRKLKDLLDFAEKRATSENTTINEQLQKLSISTPEDFKTIDFTDLTEESLREKIANPPLPDPDYNEALLRAASEGNKYDFLNTLKETQEGRRDELLNLQDMLESDSKAELKFLTQPQGPFDKIWDKLSEDDREEVSPQDIARMGAAADIGEYKQKSFTQGDVLSGTMPRESLDFKWGDIPSYEGAKSLWEEMQPNYVYSSAKPYDRRMHQLALSGHAAGSSSLENLEEAKQRAMRREDLENINLIHNMLMNEHAAKGNTIGYLDRLAESSRKAYQAPIETESKVLGDAFDRENEMRYRENVFQKDLAQMGMQEKESRLQEGAALYDLLERERLGQLAASESLSQQINQLEMLAAENKIQEAATSADFAKLRSDLWAQRKQIEAIFREQGLRAEAQALSQARNESDFISKIVGFGTKAAGAAALALTGNVPAAIGVFAPEAASLFRPRERSQGWGQSATASSGRREG